MEKHIKNEMKPNKEEKIKLYSLVSYHQVTKSNVKKNPKRLHFEQWSSSAQMSVCLADLAADIKIIESFLRPPLRDFEIWSSWWKAHRRMWRQCFKCFKSLGWNESDFSRSLKHFCSNQRKQSFTGITESQTFPEVYQGRTLKQNVYSKYTFLKHY